jgi:ProP effector
MEGWMTVTKQDIDDALARLAKEFPQTFAPEKHRPHRPLKVGIAADVMVRCPNLDRRVLSAALRYYVSRIMYLQGMVAGASRVDLNGNPAGEVSAADAEHATARLGKILAAREAGQALVAASRVERVAKPAAVAVVVLPPSAAKVALKERPVLRLPAFRQQQKRG